MYLGSGDNSLTLEKVAEYCKGEIHCDKNIIISSVSVDTRKICAGDLFIALRGENFDGHDFLPQALSKGAACAVVDKTPSCDIPYILVGNTQTALCDFASSYKKSLRVITVAVTGSVGKTTTKQFISAVLSERFKTARTEGNYNNIIGLPLTLLSAGSSHKALVAEMGMSARGEISALSKIAEPDIAVITNIGNSHIENLGSRENIRDAKLEITDGMKDGAIVILNGDEPLLSGAPAVNMCNIYFGIRNASSDFTAVNIKSSYGKVTFDVCSRFCETIKDLCINVTGAHNVYDALPAVICGVLMGLGADEIRKGLLNFTPVALRGQVIEKDGFRVLQDCYNAGPESMKAALSVLCQTAGGGRKLALLGDMRELGEYSRKLHEDVGKCVAENNIDTLITVGREAAYIASGAVENGFLQSSVISIESADDAEAIAGTVKSVLKKGDTLLIKASRALSLERITNLL